MYETHPVTKALSAPVCLLLLGTLACDREPEVQVFPSEYTDVYEQSPIRELDVLFVVDSSGSMEGEQGKLSANFPAFIDAFIQGEVNYHIGVVTTDVADESEAGLIRGLPLEPGEPVPADGVIPPMIITPDTPNAAAVFETLITVGTNGSGLEMGFEAARLALSEPRLSGNNAAFYRREAALAVVMVSDEDDLSPYPVDDYLNFFYGLKAGNVYRDGGRMTVSAIAGELPAGCTSVEEADVSYAAAGFRYVDATTKSQGSFGSICAEDFGPVVEGLGLDLSGLESEFALSYCAKPETLDVLVGQNTMALGVDYDYDPLGRLIRFVPESLPPATAIVTINYAFFPENRYVCPEN